MLKEIRRQIKKTRWRNGGTGGMRGTGKSDAASERSRVSKMSKRSGSKSQLTGLRNRNISRVDSAVSKNHGGRRSTQSSRREF